MLSRVFGVRFSPVTFSAQSTNPRTSLKFGAKFKIQNAKFKIKDVYKNFLKEIFVNHNHFDF